MQSWRGNWSVIGTPKPAQSCRIYGIHGTQACRQAFQLGAMHELQMQVLRMGIMQMVASTWTDNDKLRAKKTLYLV